MPLPATSLSSHQHSCTGMHNEQPVVAAGTTEATHVRLETASAGAVSPRKAGTARVPDDLAEAGEHSAAQDFQRLAPANTRPATTQRRLLAAASSPHEFCRVQAVSRPQLKPAAATQVEPCAMTIATTTNITIEPPAIDTCSKADDPLRLPKKLQQAAVTSTSVKTKNLGAGFRLAAADEFNKGDGWLWQAQEETNARRPQQRKKTGESKAKRDHLHRLSTQQHLENPCHQQRRSGSSLTGNGKINTGDALVDATDRVQGELALANDGATAVAGKETNPWSRTSLFVLQNCGKDNQASEMTAHKVAIATSVSSDLGIAPALCPPHEAHPSCNTSIPRAPGKTSAAAYPVGTRAEYHATAGFTGAAGYDVPATAANLAASVNETQLGENAPLGAPSRAEATPRAAREKRKEEKAPNSGNTAHSRTTKKVSGALNNKAIQRLSLNYVGCWMCVTGSSGDSTSPSPLLSSAAWSPLSACSNSPTSPTHHQAQLPLPMTPPHSAAKPEQLVPTGYTQDTKDNYVEEDIQKHHPCLSRLGERSQSTPSLILQRKGLRFLLPSRGQQQQTHFHFLSPDPLRTFTLRPLEQAQSRGASPLLKHPLCYCQLLRSDAHLGQTHTNVFHLLQHQQRHLSFFPASQHQHEEDGWPVQEQNHTQKGGYTQRPRRTETEAFHRAIRYMGGSVTERHPRLLFKTIRQLLITVRSLFLLLSHTLAAINAFRTKSNKLYASNSHEQNNSWRSDTTNSNTSKRHASSRNSRPCCICSNTASNGHSACSSCCCLAGPTSSWTGDSGRCKALPGALSRSHVLLLGPYHLDARRQSQNNRIFPVAAVSPAAARSTADCPTDEDFRMLIAPAPCRVGQDSTSVENNISERPSVLRERRAAPFWKKIFGLARFSLPTALQASPVSEAINKAPSTLGGEARHGGEEAGRGFVAAAERPRVDKEKSNKNAGSTPSLHAIAASIAGDTADSYVFPTAGHSTACALYNLICSGEKGADDFEGRHVGASAEDRCTRTTRAAALLGACPSTEKCASTGDFRSSAKGTASLAVAPTRTSKDVVNACDSPRGGEGKNSFAALPAILRERMTGTAGSTTTLADDPEPLSCLNELALAALSTACEVWKWLNVQDRTVAASLTLQGASSHSADAKNAAATTAIFAAGLPAATVTPETTLGSATDAVHADEGSPVHRPASISAVADSGEEVPALNGQPSGGPTSSCTSVEGRGATLDKTPKILRAHMVEGAAAHAVGPQATLEFDACTHTTHACRLSTAAPPRFRQKCVYEEEGPTGVATVALGDASGAVKGRQKGNNENGRTRSSCCRHRWDTRPTSWSTTWGSRRSRPGKSGRNCCTRNSTKQRSYMGSRRIFLSDCVSGSNVEDENRFCSTATSLKSVGEEAKAGGCGQKGLAIDTPTTTGASTRPGETGKAAFQAETAGAAGEHRRILGTAAAAVTSTTVARGEDSRPCQEAAGKGQKEEQELLRRRQRQMLQRSLLLLRGCWAMCLVPSTDGRNNSKTSSRNINRRRLSSHELSSGCIMRQPERTFESVGTSDGITLETSSLNPSENVQLLRRYLYVSPDFQYICCAEIPPSSAAAVGYEEIASPLPPTHQQSRQQAEPLQTQQRHFHAEQPTRHRCSLVDRHVDPQQPSHGKQLHHNQQEPREKLRPRECELQQAHTDKTLQQQAMRAWPPPQRASEQYKRLGESQPYHGKSREASEEKKLEQQRPPWEVQAQYLLRSTQQYSSDSCCEDGKGMQQAAQLEKGSEEQQEPTKDHRERQHGTDNLTTFSADLSETYARHTTLGNVSAFATDERQQNSGKQPSNRVTAAARIHGHKESKTAHQQVDSLFDPREPDLPSIWNERCGIEKMARAYTRSSSNCESAGDKRRRGTYSCPTVPQNCTEYSSNSCQLSCSVGNNTESSSRVQPVNTCSVAPQGNSCCDAVKSVKVNPCTTQKSREVKELQSVAYGAMCLPLNSNREGITDTSTRLPTWKKSDRHSCTSLDLDSLVLGYGSLDGTTGFRMCSPECPAGCAHMRKRLLRPAKSVLPPASCAWFCATKNSSPVKSWCSTTSNNDKQKNHINPRRSSSSSEQQMQQRQPFQEVLKIESLKQQQENLQARQKPLDQLTEPASSCHQQHLEVAQRLCKKQQQQQDDRNAYSIPLLRQASSEDAISSSSNCKGSNEHQWPELSGELALPKAAMSPSVLSKIANAAPYSTLAVATKASHAPSPSEIAGDPACGLNKRNSRNTYEAELEPTASAAQTLLVEGQGELDYAEVLTAELQTEPVVTGAGQRAIATLATLEDLAAAVADTAGESPRNPLRSLQPLADIVKSSSSDNKSSRPTVEFGSSSIVTSGAGKSPRSNSKNDISSDSIGSSVKIQSANVTQCTTHILPRANLWSPDVAFDEISSEHTTVAPSPLCVATAASPFAYARSTTSDIPSCATVLPGVASGASGIRDSTDAVSFADPEGCAVQQRIGRRTCKSRDDRSSSSPQGYPVHIIPRGVMKQQLQRCWCADAQRGDSGAAVQQGQNLSTVCIPLRRVCSLEYGYGSSTYQRLQHSRCSALQSVPPYLCFSIRITLPGHVVDKHAALTVVQQPDLLYQQEDEEETQPQRIRKAIQIDVGLVALTAADAARWVIGLNGLIPHSPGRVLYTQEEVAKRLRVMRRQQKQRWKLERFLRRWRRAIVATAQTQMPKLPLQSSPVRVTTIRSLVPSRSRGTLSRGILSLRRARHINCRPKGAALRVSNCTGVSNRSRQNRSRNNKARGLRVLNAYFPYNMCKKTRTEQPIFSRSRTRVRKAMPRRNSTTSQVSSTHCSTQDRSDDAVHTRRTSEKVNASNGGQNEPRGEGGRSCSCARRVDPHCQTPPARLRGSSSHTCHNSASIGSDIDTGGGDIHSGTECNRVTVITSRENCGGAGSLQTSPQSGRSATYCGGFHTSSMEDNESRVKASSNGKEQEQQQLRTLVLRCHHSSAVPSHKAILKEGKTRSSSRHRSCNCSTLSHVSTPEEAASAGVAVSQSSCRTADCCSNIRGLRGSPSFPRAPTTRSYSAPPILSRGNREEEKHHRSAIPLRQAAGVNGRLDGTPLTLTAFPECALNEHRFAVNFVTASAEGGPCAAPSCPVCSRGEAVTAMENEKRAHRQTKQRRPFFHRLLRFATLRLNAKLQRHSSSVPSSAFTRRSCCNARHSGERNVGDSGTASNYVTDLFNSDGAFRIARSTVFQRSNSACGCKCGRLRAVNLQHSCRCSGLEASALAQNRDCNSTRLEDSSFWRRRWDASPAAPQQEDGNFFETSLVGSATSGEEGQAQLQELLPLPDQPEQQRKGGQERLDSSLQREQVRCRGGRQRPIPSQPPRPRGWLSRQQLLLYVLRGRRDLQMGTAQQGRKLHAATGKCARYEDIISPGLLRHAHSIGSSSTCCTSSSSLGSGGPQLHHDASTLETFPRAAGGGCNSHTHTCCFGEIQGQQQLPQHHWKRKAGQQEHDGGQQNQIMPEEQQEDQNRRQPQPHPQSWEEFGCCRFTSGFVQPQHHCYTHTCPRSNIQSNKGSLAYSIACKGAFFYRRCASCSSISRVSSPCSTTIGTPSTMSFCSSPGGRSTSSADYRTSSVQDRCIWKEFPCFTDSGYQNFSQHCFNTEHAGSTSPSSTLGGSVRGNTTLARPAGDSPAFVPSTWACSSVPIAAADAVEPGGATEADKCTCAVPVERADAYGGTVPKLPNEQVGQPNQEASEGNFDDVFFHQQESQQLKLSAIEKVERQRLLNSKQGNCIESHEEFEGITPIAEEDNLSDMHKQEEYQKGDLDTSGKTVTRLSRGSNEDGSDSDEEFVLFSAF